MKRSENKQDIQLNKTRRPVEPNRKTTIILIFIASAFAVLATVIGIRRRREQCSGQIKAVAGAGGMQSGAQRSCHGDRKAAVNSAGSSIVSIDSAKRIRRAGRTRRIWKRIYASAAVILTVALVGSGAMQYGDPMTAIAKESFTGIGQIVKKHDEKDPYKILDIVPSRAYYDVNVEDDAGNITDTKRYSFSTGTIGYLAGGQTSLTSDLMAAFENPVFRFKQSRTELFNRVLAQSSLDTFPGVKYEEAYGGVHKSISESEGWKLVFEDQEVDPGNVAGADLGKMAEGIFKGTYKKKQAGDDSKGYDFAAIGNVGGGASAGQGIYEYNPGTGAWHITFASVDSLDGQENLYVAQNPREYHGDYSESTGLYYLDDSGRYVYVGTVGEVLLHKNVDYYDKDQGNKEDDQEDNTDDDKDQDDPDDGTDNTGGDGTGDNTGGDGTGDNTGDGNTDGNTGGDGTGDNTGDGNTDGNTGDDGTGGNPGGDDNTGSDGNPDGDGTGDNTGNDGTDGNPGGSDDNSGGDHTGGDSEDSNTGNDGAGGNSGGDSGDDTGDHRDDGIKVDEAAAMDTARNAAITGRWYRLVEDGSDGTDAGSGNDGDNTGDGNPDGSGENPDGNNPGDNPGNTGGDGEEDGSGDSPGGTGGGSNDPDQSDDEQNDSDGNINPDPVPGGNGTPDSGAGNVDDNNGSNADGSTGGGSSNGSDIQYYVVEFRHVEDPSVEVGPFYTVQDTRMIKDEDGVVRPYDAYDVAEPEIDEEELAAISAFSVGDAVTADAAFLYVGAGKGDYKLTASNKSDTILEVFNAPVYVRCTSGNDWLRKYVFSSLSGGDNERQSFTIEVETARAEEVTPDMIMTADMVYLESGLNSILGQSLLVEYIQQSEHDLVDMQEGVVKAILARATEDLMPVIVDYDVTTSKNYEDTNYQYLGRALLKRDLATFYDEMNRKDKLMDNMKMYFKNVDESSDKDEEFPDKNDNSYNYVNQNVYVVNGELPLVSEDFHEPFSKDDTKRGFAEVVAAIKAENTTLSEDDQISESVSKAKAIQYIINYSVGIIGEFEDLNILELQPSANTKSDLHRVVDDKGYTKLCWATESMKTAKQILYSKKSFEVNTSVKSVAQFNGEWEDINSTYDLIFIGLDGQRLNRGNDRERSTVYNNKDLDGMVYHVGDESGVGSYDGNDITAQKMMDLLEYMAAGYPVLVENNCFKDGTAQDASGDDINTKYIHEDSVMYHFLRSAVSDERYEERIFTVSDAMSNALFMTQVKIGKPRVELQREGDEEPYAVQTLSLDENNEYHGRIAYEIKNNRGGEYPNATVTHLYFDLNYDGMFEPTEELGEYINEGNAIDIVISGMGPGILPWKLEIADEGNQYRRDSVQGYFELSGTYVETVDVLQITQAKGDVRIDLQEMYDRKEDSILAEYLRGTKGIANISLDIESVTPADLAAALATDSGYLNQWDIVVLTLDNAGAVDSVREAIERYVGEGRSLLVCGQNAAGNRMGLSGSLLGQMEDSRTYVSLGAGGASGYYRYAGLKPDMFEAQTYLQSEQINEGIIDYYPYRLDNKSFRFGAEGLIRASDYLLDCDTLKTDGDEAYVTAWYTLGGDSEQTAYGISPKDARNNYYCYSKGNVVYLGQSEYTYTYDKDAGEVPDLQEGADECKFFVNALMLAYSAGVHKADVSIVAGFAQDSAKMKSISVPFDKELTSPEGILDNTVEVFFKFADSNIGLDKVTEIRFYYQNPDGDQTLSVDGESVQATEFTSEIWTVTNNRLVPAGNEDIIAGKVYRIHAPVLTLKSHDGMNNASIYISVKSNFTRNNRVYEAEGIGSVSLNRARLFLLE